MNSMKLIIIFITFKHTWYLKSSATQIEVELPWLSWLIELRGGRRRQAFCLLLVLLVPAAHTEPTDWEMFESFSLLREH